MTLRARAIRWSWVAAAGLAVAAGVACEGLPRSVTPAMPLWVHHPGSSLSVFVRRQLTMLATREGEPYESGRPALDPFHRRVFVGSSDSGLYALNAVTGDTIWRYETTGAVQCEPLYVLEEDVLYFGSNDGALYKVRAADGHLLWRFATNAEVTRKPLIDGDTLFITNANDTLVAIDHRTGKMRWYRHRTPAFGMEISGYAGPAVFQDKVYTAFSDGVVMAYSTKDGSERWRPVDLTADVEQSRSGQELRYLDVDTTPIVTKAAGEDVVIVASYEGGVYALDAQTGLRVWSLPAPAGVTELALWEWPKKPDSTRTALTTPAPVPRPPDSKPSRPMHRVLVASSGLTGLWGLDPDDGSEMWRRDLPAGGITAPAAVSGALVVGTTRYGIFLFSPLDGGVIDGIHGGSSFAAAPAGYGTRAYLFSNEGILLGLHVQPPVLPGG